MPRWRLSALWGAISIILFWELAVKTLEVPSYVVPAPSAVILYMATNPFTLIENAAWTLAEALAGAALAIPFGIAIAVLLAWSRFLDYSIRPLVIVAQSTPLIAVAPLLTAWLGPHFLSKAVLAGILSFPSLVTNLQNALQFDKEDEVDLFISMGASKWQMLYYLRFPRALPALLSSLQVIVPLAILGAIVGEFVGASRGLGFQIMRASYYMRTVEMFAAVAVASCFAVILVELLRTLTKRVLWTE